MSICLFIRMVMYKARSVLIKDLPTQILETYIIDIDICSNNCLPNCFPNILWSICN